MAKKRKQQADSPPQQTSTGNEEELELIGQKEIEATLDMIIRKFEPPTSSHGNEDTNNSDSDCTDNADTDAEGNQDTDTDRAEDTCFIPPVHSFGGLNLFLTCADLFIFELDEEVIQKLVLCAIVSMSLDGFLNFFKLNFIPSMTPFIRSIEKQLDDRAANVYNQFLLQVMTGIQTAKSKKDYIQNLFQSNLLGGGRKRNLMELLTANLQNVFAPEKSSCDFETVGQQLDQIIRGAALTFLFNSFAFKFAEFQKAVGLKVSCVEADLTFLSTELLRLTSVDAGILQAANALVLVASARFAEEENYDEIFEAVEEIADVIEDLAEIYRDRLKVLRALLPFSSCPRPIILPQTELE